MKLYVLSLYHIVYDSEYIVGIFDSLEKAKNIFQDTEWIQRDNGWYSPININDEVFYIKEYSLNERIHR